MSARYLPAFTDINAHAFQEPGYSRAQTFTALTTGTLTRIESVMSAQVEGQPPAIVRVTTVDAAGHPATPITGDVSIPATADIASRYNYNEPRNIGFAPGTQIIAGNTYAIVVDNSAPDLSPDPFEQPWWEWAGRLTNPSPYADGINLHRTGPTQPWVELAGFDGNFTVYVEDGTAPADQTPPQITIAAPVDGATYLLGEAVTASYSCADDVDASPSCSGTLAPGAALDTSSVGTKSFTVQSTDAAGNVASKTVTYDVHYEMSPLSAPIDSQNVNLAKAGATVPVKWRVLDAAGAPITDASNFVSVTSHAGSGACAGAPTDAIETYTGGAGLQYLGDGWWQYNWKTPKSYAGQCRTMKLNLAGGQSATAPFQFK